MLRADGTRLAMVRRVARNVTKFWHLVWAVITLCMALLITTVDRRGNNLIDDCRTQILRGISSVNSLTTNFTSKIFGTENKLLTMRLEESNKRANMLGLYMQSVINENHALKRLLGYVSSSDIYRNHSFVTTNVVGQIASIASGMVLINMGSDNGIAVGQAVINENGLVGKVVKVFENTAEVMLVTDHRLKIPVVMRDSTERAIYSGSTLHLSFANKQPKAFDGEMAMTIGDDRLFPSYIPVGIARIVDGPIGAVFYLDIFVDVNKLDYVLVITG